MSIFQYATSDEWSAWRAIEKSKQFDHIKGMESKPKDWYNAKINHRVELVNRRIGDPCGRIRHLAELNKFIGKPFVAVCHNMISKNRPKNENNKVLMFRGFFNVPVEGLNFSNIINADRTSFYMKTGADGFINLELLNVIPNNYNNHAIFITEGLANNYLDILAKEFGTFRIMEKLPESEIKKLHISELDFERFKV